MVTEALVAYWRVHGLEVVVLIAFCMGLIRLWRCKRGLKGSLAKSKFVTQAVLWAAGCGLWLVASLCFGFYGSVLCRSIALCLPTALENALNSRPPWTLMSGVAVAPSLALLWIWRTRHRIDEVKAAQDQARSSHAEQLASQFSKACEMLAELEKHTSSFGMGAIYALKAVAIGSAKDYGEAVARVLNAKLREVAVLTNAERNSQLAFSQMECEPRLPNGDYSQVTSAVLSVLGQIGGFTRVRVNLSGCVLMGEQLPKAQFKEAVLVNAHLTSSNLSGADLQDATCAGAQLDDVNLQGADLRGAQFQNANLQRANLQEAQLVGANFSGTNLRGARLQNQDLERAWLERVNLQDTDLQTTNLKRANLYAAKLQRAKFEKTDLEHANLECTELEGARFRCALLKGTGFKGANFKGANLEGANLLECRDLTFEQVQRAFGNNSTTLPKEVQQTAPPRWRIQTREEYER